MTQPVFQDFELSFKLMRWVLMVFLLSSQFERISAQDAILRCSDGEIRFLSSAPLEQIEARSNELKGVIDSELAEFGFSLNIKTFQGFNSPLQRDHFNENYLESDKYPAATFSGKIIEAVDFQTPGIYQVRAKGILNIHGVDQERIIKGVLTISDKSVMVTASFRIKLQDHNISVPRIVFHKIAEEIEVSLEAKFTPSYIE